MIEISIIIPICNQADTLLKTLDSLKNQIKQKRNFEIIVCDDGSTDGIGERLKSLNYPIFFKYLKNNPPLGRAQNRNHGFKNSSGERVIFIDGDMIPSSEFINAYAKADIENTVSIGGIKLHPDIKRNHFEDYLYQRGLYRAKPEGEELPGRLFASGNFMISRKLFERYNGFDTAFAGWGGEDLDFGLRLEKNKVRIISVPKALTQHRHKKTLISMADDYYRFGQNSFKVLIEKHPEITSMIPLHQVGIVNRSTGSNPISRLISGLLVNSVMLGMIKKIVTKFKNIKWSDRIYSYIIWGSLGLGYKQREGNE